MADKDIGRRSWGEANPDGNYRYGSQEHLGKLLKEGRDAQERSNRQVYGGGGSGSGGRGFPLFKLIFLGIIGAVIWSGIQGSKDIPRPPSNAQVLSNFHYQVQLSHQVEWEHKLGIKSTGNDTLSPEAIKSYLNWLEKAANK
jgi:hypothetical protein